MVSLQKLTVGCLIVLSSACSTTKPPQQPPAYTAPEKVKVDPRALQACNKLPALQLDPTQDPFYQLLEHLAAIVTEYSDCAARQDNSVKLLKDFGGLNEPSK